MRANRTQRKYRLGQNETIGHSNFQRVQRFKYLGPTVTTDSSISEEIKGRMSKAEIDVLSLYQNYSLHQACREHLKYECIKQ